MRAPDFPTPMHDRLQRLLRRLPIAGRLGLLVGLFGAILGCLVLLAHVQVEVLSGVRAYVGGESRWSSAQKDAIQFLKRYVDTRDATEYRRFLEALAVPLGDRRARLELDRPDPDPAVVADGFVAGGNHPADVAVMGRFYRTMRHVSYMAAAVDIWKLGDRYVHKLRRLGEAVHREVSTGDGRTPRLRAVLAKLDLLNDRMTPLEKDFSRTLGDGARYVKSVLLAVNYIAAACLLTIGLGISWVMFRSLKLGEEARVFEALSQVGRELISSLETSPLLERLCRLSTKVLACETSRTLLWDATTDAFVPAAGDVGGAAALSLEAANALFARPGHADVTEVRLPDGPRGEPRVALAMALRNGGELIGVQLATRRGRGGFAPGEHRVAEGIAYLASMALANTRLVGEIERVSRLKSEFMSTMSHELRTPLNVILGYAEMVRDGGLGPHEQVECGAHIERAGRDLLALIEDTLAIGRMDDGLDDGRVEPLELATVWAALRDACGALPRSPRVELVWVPEVPNVELLADLRKLTVIVRNLVGNGLKFTERGWVRAEVRLEGGGLAVRVSDTGIGVRPEDQRAIFEMFRQADGSETRRFGGTGLGLYIARRFAEQLGATLALASTPGRGSVFTVAFPPRLVKAAPRRAASAA